MTEKTTEMQEPMDFLDEAIGHVEELTRELNPPRPGGARLGSDGLLHPDPPFDPERWRLKAAHVLGMVHILLVEIQRKRDGPAKRPEPLI